MTLDNLGSTWYHSETSEVPYCTKHVFRNDVLKRPKFQNCVRNISMASNTEQFMYSQVPIKQVGPNKRVGWVF